MSRSNTEYGSTRNFAEIQDIIVTRDLRDFKEAKIPVMTAEEYLTSKEKPESS